MTSLHKLSKAHERPDPSGEVWPFDGLDAGTVALVVIALGIMIFLLQFMQALLAPLAFGILLFYALDPAVDFMERARVPRWIGAALVLGVTIATILVGGYMLQSQALTVINELPAGARRIAALVERQPRAAPGPLDKVEQAAEELAKTDKAKPPPGVMRVQVEEPRITATGLLWSGSMGAVGWVNQLIMILFLTYFILLSDKLLRRKFVELAGPTLSKKKVTLEIINDISAQIAASSWCRSSRALSSASRPGRCWRTSDWNQAALWGLLAGVFNSIPYYGPLIVSGGLSLVAFLQFGTFSMMILVAGISLDHHITRGLAPDADAHGQSRGDESCCGLRGAAVLELGVGCLGPAPGGSDDDVDQGRLRPCRGSQANRPFSRRVVP